MNAKRPQSASSLMRSHLADRRLMAIAGLWETWRSPAAEWVRSFTIVTTVPSRITARQWSSSPTSRPVWLREQPADGPQLKALLTPYPSDEMICWLVSARVGNVKSNDPGLIEPIAGVA